MTVVSDTDTQNGTQGGGGDVGLDRATLIVASVVIIGALMSILDATVVNVAIATLARELDSTLPTIQWVISGYTLALASVIPISGWAADRYGARRVWLIAVVLFTCGSILCAFAWSAEALIAFRVLQGVGGGLLTPVGTTILTKTAGPQRVGRVMSLMGVPLALGPILGPVVGGFLLGAFNWNWIFLINVPIGVVAVALGWYLLPRTEAQPTDRLDIAGLLLLSPGLAALIFSVSEVRTVSDLTTPAVLLGIVLGLVFIGGFIWRSLRVSAPLVDLRLFAGRTFSAAAISTFVLGVGTFGAMLLLPLYFQQVRGETALVAGLLTTPQAIGMAISMSISGTLTDRIGAGWVVPAGLVFAIGAFLGLTTISSTSSFWTTSVALFALGLGLGSSMMPAMSAAYSTLSGSAVARATSELQVVQRVGSTFGSALFAVVLAQRIASSSSSPGSAGGGGGAAAAATLGEAYAGAFWWAVGLSVVALIPSLLLPRRHISLRSILRGHSNPLSGNVKQETTESQ